MAAMIQPNYRHHLQGVFWMVVGSVVVFGSLLFINDSPTIEKTQSSQMASEFQVKPPEKPKPKRKVARKEHKRESAPPTPALVADLNMELSGLDFGFGSFSDGGMGEIDDSLLGETDNIVMTGDMVDTPPRVKKRTALEYPARAKAKELEGYVVLSIYINAEGKVEDARVLESDPKGTFDDAAIKAVKSWIFTPAKYDGKAVEIWANQTIRFELG